MRRMFPRPLAVVGLLVAFIAFVTSAAPSWAVEPDRPPNVVLIYCDDLGYADVGCFGSKPHRTPHIDRLAAEGLRLTSFYVTSGVCTPSRSSLMTGCYPRRVNMHQNARGDWVLFPIDSRGLNPDEVTIAEVLKTRGYATACIGKWHLGDQPEFLPTRQGFDSWFGIPYSNDMGTKQRRPQPNPPVPLMDGERVIEAPAEQSTLTRRYTERAVEFITANRDTPFFLYLPHTFPHWPLHASEAFRGKSANGTYGDSVEEIDASTGAILDALDELGLADDTIVIFTSDNGAAKPHGGSNAPLRGFKGGTWEGGMRVPFVLRWPSRVPAGTESDEIVSTLDILPTFASLAGAVLPEETIDGVDVGRMLTDPERASPRRTFYYYFKDQLQAVRLGRWKMHLPRGEGDKRITRQLYDLDSDVSETHNIADAYPDVVAALQTVVDEAREQLGDRGSIGAGQRPPGEVSSPTPRELEPR